jgi:large subunit ribosomal protein L20
MTRVKTGVTRRRAHKKLLGQTKGFRMTKNRLVKVAIEAVLHRGEYAFAGRKQKKRQFRTLWIQRINAALMLGNSGLSYSKFIGALKTSNIVIDRKILARMANEVPAAFEAVVLKAQGK